MFNELKSMAIFAEVVNKGSFRSAAKSLGLSPSVVSYHIAQLEQRMGTALLYRSTRKLTLSHEGMLFHEHVAQMMSAAKMGIEQLSTENTLPPGKLKVSLPTALTISSLNQKVARFANLYPNITLNLNFSDHNSNIIEDGIDIAIRAGEPETSNLKSRKIGEISRMLVCAPACFQQHDSPNTPKDLTSWSWIKLEQLPNARTFYRNGLPQLISYPYQISVNSVEAVKQYCLLGAGLATLSVSQVADSVNKGELIHVLPEWEIKPIPLYALWPGNVTPQSNVKRLLKVLTGE